MPLEALTSREAVLKALAEYDDIGRDAFLARYGFRPARDVVLVHEGRQYDSKPIVAAAHGYEHPDVGPLTHSEFNGGRPTASKLEELGFEIERLSSSTRDSSAGALLANFLRAYRDAKTTPFSGQHPAVGLLKAAAEALAELLPPQLGGAVVRPSVGQGNWAHVPWIAVLDPRETTTTQRGVYPVILIPETLDGAYLTIVQGVTDLRRELGVRAAHAELDMRAHALSPYLGGLRAHGFDGGESVQLGASSLARDYVAAVVTAKYFSIDDLTEGDYEEDYVRVCLAYSDLLDTGVLPGRGAPRTPAVMSVYVGRNAELNFEAGGRRGWWGWRQAYPDFGQVQVGDLILFGFGYTGGSPRVDAEEWGRNGLTRIVVGRIEQVPFRTDEAIMPDELTGQDSYPYKIRFEPLQELRDISFGKADGLSPEVAEAQRLSAIRQGAGIVRSVSGSPVLEALVETPSEIVLPVTPIDELVSTFVAAIGASGLNVPQPLASAFLVAAIAKPFVILTGLSGSGKTQLAKRLGEWCGVDGEGRPRYQVIPVRPDWTGPEYLFGFPDALEDAVDGRAVWAVPATLEFLLRATRDSKMPYVLVLDEMNLAHVERYFADFLSGIESREPVLPDLMTEGSSWVERTPGRTIPLPRNVVVIGTVNVDETTYLFSPKVLDRAFTFEFRVTAADLDPSRRRPKVIEPAPLAAAQSIVGAISDDDWQFKHPHPELAALATDLRAMHELLSPAGLEFGHRVMYEALRFASMLHAAVRAGRLDALDLVAMLKILPRIHGSRQRLEPTLRALLSFAEGENPEDPRLPFTSRKARRMLDVLLDVQFVSFTE